MRVVSGRGLRANMGVNSDALRRHGAARLQVADNVYGKHLGAGSVEAN